MSNFGIFDHATLSRIAGISKEVFSSAPKVGEGRGAPEGTEHVWSDGERYKKTGSQWVHVASGKSDHQNHEKIESHYQEHITANKQKIQTPHELASQGSRFRPKEMVRFPKPLTGPSGAKLVAYEWAWKPEEYQDKFGETKTKKVSDWERAQASAETGKDLVHHFHVEHPNGEKKIVSSESLPKVLGFTTEEHPDKENVKSMVSSAKTLAKLRMQKAILDSKHAEYKKHRDEIAAMPKPPITIDNNQFMNLRMGDVGIRNSNAEIPEERKRVLHDTWIDRRLAERGIAHPGHGLSDLERKIAKHEKKMGIQ